MLNNDVFLHNLVVLVVVIPTSPRLSKTEFGYKSYCISGSGRFLDRKRKEKKETKKKGRVLPSMAGGMAGGMAGPSLVPGRP